MYPAPQLLAFPTFLGGESPLVLAYRRETAIAEKFHLPECLTSAFLSNPDRVLQWAVLMRRVGYALAQELTAVGSGLSEFLLPPVEGLRTSGGYNGAWPPGGPWMSEARGEAG